MDGSTYGILRDAEAPSATAKPAGAPPNVQGVLYAEDFDGPDTAPVEEPKPTAPTIFSASDIDAARAAGHQAGFSAAKSDSDSVRADLQVAALQSLADAMAATRTEAADIAEQRAQSLSGAVMAVLSAALPKVTESHAKAELTAVLEALLPGLRAEPVLRVRVHPDLEECVRAAWRKLSQDEPSGELQLTADPTLARGDVRLTWADGRAARNTAEIWEGIRQALAPLGMPALEDIVDGR